MVTEFKIKVKIAQMTGCWPSCNDCEHYAHGENEMSGLFPNLMVDDMIETLSFYEGIGFSIVTKLPVENPIWALLELDGVKLCLLYTSPSPRDLSTSRMPSSA